MSSSLLDEYAQFRAQLESELMKVERLVGAKPRHARAEHFGRCDPSLDRCHLLQVGDLEGQYMAAEHCQNGSVLRVSKTLHLHACLHGKLAKGGSSIPLPGSLHWCTRGAMMQERTHGTDVRAIASPRSCTPPPHAHDACRASKASSHQRRH